MNISVKQLVQLFGESALELKDQNPALARLVARMAVLAAHVDFSQRMLNQQQRAVVDLDKTMASTLQLLAPLLQQAPEGGDAAPTAAPAPPSANAPQGVPPESANDGESENDAVEKMVNDALAATAADEAKANVTPPKPPKGERVPATEVVPLVQRKQK